MTAERSASGGRRGALIRRWQELDGEIRLIARHHPTPAAHLRLALMELRPYLLTRDDNLMSIFAMLDQLQGHLADIGGPAGCMTHAQCAPAASRETGSGDALGSTD